MYKVTRFTVDPNDPNQDSGMWIGGETAYVSDWPLNPEGQPLLHLFSINCNTLSQQVHIPSLPKDKYISVFSTYSASEYFLDLVTYTGDEPGMEREYSCRVHLCHSIFASTHFRMSRSTHSAKWRTFD